MSKDNFMKSLKHHASKFKWEISRGGYLRAYKDGKLFCPVTAVYYARMGNYYTPARAYDASNELYGIRYIEYLEGKTWVNSVIGAADTFNRKTKNPKTQQRLLNAIGNRKIKRIK